MVAKGLMYLLATSIAYSWRRLCIDRCFSRCFAVVSSIAVSAVRVVRQLLSSVQQWQSQTLIWNIRKCFSVLLTLSVETEQRHALRVLHRRTMDRIAFDNLPTQSLNAKNKGWSVTPQRRPSAWRSGTAPGPSPARAGLSGALQSAAIQSRHSSPSSACLRP